MSDRKPGLQPDIAAYMASLETTNEPLEMCYSCQRARLYAAMLYAGSVMSDLIAIGNAGWSPMKWAIAMQSAKAHQQALMDTLAEFVRVDLAGSLPGARELSKEDWAMAMESFFRARTEHYVADDGTIKFEPHNEDGMPDIFGDPDDGVTAK